MNFQIDFSDAQKRRSLVLLSLFHIFIIAISNYLVQITFEVKIPFTDIVIPTTWGTFTFPFVFLATDLTVRVFGASLARKIIFVGMLPALLISYVISVLFLRRNFKALMRYTNLICLCSVLRWQVFVLMWWGSYWILWCLTAYVRAKRGGWHRCVRPFSAL